MSARYADAIAMNTYPSTGLKVHGFEFKSDRADLVRELGSVEKSAAIQKYCDYWWLVLGHKDLIRAGELPSTWGLIVPYGGGLHKIVKAPKLDPCALNRPFVASLLRCAQRHLLPYAQIEKAEQKGYRQGFENGKDEKGFELKRLKETVKAFEQASGINIIDEWQGERIGAAARFIVESGVDRVNRELETHLKSVRRALEHSERKLLELRENGMAKIVKP